MESKLLYFAHLWERESALGVGKTRYWYLFLLLKKVPTKGISKKVIWTKSKELCKVAAMY